MIQKEVCTNFINDTLALDAYQRPPQRNNSNSNNGNGNGNNSHNNNNRKTYQHPTRLSQQRRVEGVVHVTNLCKDLCDSTIICKLLEVLTGESVSEYGQLVLARTRVERLQNALICLRFIHERVPEVFIGPADIADGNERLLSGMVWSLLLHFTLTEIGGGNTIAELQTRLMQWVTSCAKEYNIVVRNFSGSFMDGRLLLALLHSADPSCCPYVPSSDASSSIQLASAVAFAVFGVPRLLSHNSPSLCMRYDSLVAVYVAQMALRLPRRCGYPMFVRNLISWWHFPASVSLSVSSLMRCCDRDAAAAAAAVAGSERDTAATTAAVPLAAAAARATATATSSSAVSEEEEEHGESAVVAVADADGAVEVTS